MPPLTDAQRLGVRAQVMSLFSQRRHEVPVTKSQLLAFIERADDGLDANETSVVSGLPAGDAKTWLIAHPELGRQVLSLVQSKRTEEL